MPKHKYYPMPDQENFKRVIARVGRESYWRMIKGDKKCSLAIVDGILVSINGEGRVIAPDGVDLRNTNALIPSMLTEPEPSDDARAQRWARATNIQYR